jgi:hypothetical protein
MAYSLPKTLITLAVLAGSTLAYAEPITRTPFYGCFDADPVPAEDSLLPRSICVDSFQILLRNIENPFQAPELGLVGRPIEGAFPLTQVGSGRGGPLFPIDVRSTILNKIESEGSCGEYRDANITLNFSMNAQGGVHTSTFVFVGTERSTSDNCHISMKTQQVKYRFRD